MLDILTHATIVARNDGLARAPSLQHDDAKRLVTARQAHRIRDLEQADQLVSVAIAQEPDCVSYVQFPSS